MLQKLVTLGAMDKYIKQYNMNFDVCYPININGPTTDPLWEYLKASQSLIHK